MEQERSVPLWNKPTRKKTHAVVLGLVSASPLFSTYGRVQDCTVFTTSRELVVLWPLNNLTRIVKIIFSFCE